MAVGNQKIDQPPSTDNPAFDSWARRLVTAINKVPQMSVESLSESPADSGYTGDIGDIIVNTSSDASQAYINTDGTLFGWELIHSG